MCNQEKPRCAFCAEALFPKEAPLININFALRQPLSYTNYQFCHKRCQRSLDNLRNFHGEERIGVLTVFCPPDHYLRECVDFPQKIFDEICQYFIPYAPTKKMPNLSAQRRFEILRRDLYRCRLCGIAAQDAPHVRLEVDHITARAHGGTNDPINLWTLCAACNRGKGTNYL